MSSSIPQEVRDAYADMEIMTTLFRNLTEKFELLKGMHADALEKIDELSNELTSEKSKSSDVLCTHCNSTQQRLDHLEQENEYITKKADELTIELYKSREVKANFIMSPISVEEFNTVQAEVEMLRQSVRNGTTDGPTAVDMMGAHMLDSLVQPLVLSIEREREHYVRDLVLKDATIARLEADIARLEMEHTDDKEESSTSTQTDSSSIDMINKQCIPLTMTPDISGVNVDQQQATKSLSDTDDNLSRMECEPYQHAQTPAFEDIVSIMVAELNSKGLTCVPRNVHFSIQSTATANTCFLSTENVLLIDKLVLHLRVKGVDMMFHTRTFDNASHYLGVLFEETIVWVKIHANDIYPSLQVNINGSSESIAPHRHHNAAPTHDMYPFSLREFAMHYGLSAGNIDPNKYVLIRNQLAYGPPGMLVNDRHELVIYSNVLAGLLHSGKYKPDDRFEHFRLWDRALVSHYSTAKVPPSAGSRHLLIGRFYNYNVPTLRSFINGSLYRPNGMYIYVMDKILYTLTNCCYSIPLLNCQTDLKSTSNVDIQPFLQPRSEGWLLERVHTPYKEDGSIHLAKYINGDNKCEILIQTSSNASDKQGGSAPTNIHYATIGSIRYCRKEIQLDGIYAFAHSGRVSTRPCFVARSMGYTNDMIMDGNFENLLRQYQQLRNETVLALSHITFGDPKYSELKGSLECCVPLVLYTGHNGDIHKCSKCGAKYYAPLTCCSKVVHM